MNLWVIQFNAFMSWILWCMFFLTEISRETNDISFKHWLANTIVKLDKNAFSPLRTTLDSYLNIMVTF